MADNPDGPPAHEPRKEVTVKDAPRAPIIYFEVVPTFGFNDGIVNVMLALGLILPTTDGGTLTEGGASALHCPCSCPAARYP